LLALLLSQHNIPSLVLEAWDRLDERLRATQYGVPATRIFRRAGILDDLRAVSISSFPSICWRRVSDGKWLTGIDLSVVKDHPDRMTILPLNQIIQIMYRHCTERGKGLIEVRFNHRVVDVGQDQTKAWADVEMGEAKEKVRFEADYVVGCDGATSAVRKALFGGLWRGETHDCRLLVQNVSFAVPDQ
jgi:2-polyprenyl-6-methoxyphenol hydroxylase-like FAD-dependent oxidoreductase